MPGRMGGSLRVSTAILLLLCPVISYEESDADSGNPLVFVLFGLILIAFVFLQFRLGDIATVPVRIASQRTIASASLFGICIGGSFFTFIYYIPIWVRRAV